MKKFRIVMIILAALLIIYHITTVNFDDLGPLNNAGAYLGITLGIIIIFSMIISNRQEKNK